MVIHLLKFEHFFYFSPLSGNCCGRRTKCQDLTAFRYHAGKLEKIRCLRREAGKDKLPRRQVRLARADLCGFDLRITRDRVDMHRIDESLSGRKRYWFWIFGPFAQVKARVLRSARRRINSFFCFRLSSELDGFVRCSKVEVSCLSALSLAFAIFVATQKNHRRDLRERATAKCRQQ